MDISVPLGCGLVAGMKVFVVCEVTLDGKPHPTPYARLPTVGPFSDWNLVNTIGRFL